jgi:hypothetical protein
MTNKYGNVKIEIDGIIFHSKGEANRYLELKHLMRGGVISRLELQPKFTIAINGYKICDYIADFSYIENGDRIVEDFKGHRTDVYKLKKKLVKALYGVDIRETHA